MLRKIIHYMLLVLLLIMNAFLSGSGTASAENKILLAGISKVKITPETPIPMSGYGGRKKPFKGIHDDIFVRTIVFESGGEKAAIISAELIGFSHDFWEELAGRIENETGISSSAVLLSAVHNHGGPVTMVYNREPDPDIAEYRVWLMNRISDSVKEALGSMQAVTIGASSGECLMNINRRAYNPASGSTLGRNPYGPCDHEVGVVRIDKADGTPLAVLVNWACHGVVMGPRNLLITGDWPGAMARYIEENSDGLMAFLTIGASGDINPIYGPHIDFEDVRHYAYGMDEIGMVLGKEAMRVFSEIETRPESGISVEQKVIGLPKKTDETQFQQPKLGDKDTVDLRLTVLKVGTLVLAGVSGELFTEIGMQVKDRSPYRFTQIVTHCNGSSGYFVTDKSYEAGGYEPRSTRAKQGGEGIIVESLLDMIYGL